MTDINRNRRRFLELTGAAALAAGVGTAVSGTAGAQASAWSAADSSTGKTLNDVVQTSEGPYAVGSGGLVLARRDDGWETVISKGPTVESNTLKGAGVTDDGNHVWFAGGSGVIGQYDVADEELTDYSAPMGKTSTWEDLAVTGKSGSETVHLVNGSGEVLNGTKNDSGGMDWGEAQKPGSGSSMKGIDFASSSVGHISNTSTKVYETTDDGGSYQEIGIDGGSIGLYGVASVSESDVNVAGGSGTIYRYDGSTWSPLKVGQNTIYGIDRDGEMGLAAGSGGRVYERNGPGTWSEVETPTTNTLRGAALDTAGGYPDVAVGSSGTIVERGEYTADPPAERKPRPDSANWTEASSPTGKGLNDTVLSSQGPYAVGGGGRVLERGSTGWTTVIEKGPTTQGNTLTGAGVTDDGNHVWFAGGSGVIGQYDVGSGTKTDYSKPEGKSSTWEDIAVVGAAGSETVFLINGSGEFFSGTKNGSGGMDWGSAVKPGGGSSAKGLDFIDESTGYICDTNSKVYETTNGGDSWEEIGIGGGSVGLYDVAAVSSDEINVAGGDGSIFRYNGSVWTKLYAGQNTLNAITREGKKGLAAGSSGTVLERTGSGWQSDETPTSNGLEGIVLDTTGSYPDVAVGASGTIVERGEYTASPEPVGEFENPPQDLDEDGKYEDVDGDGELTKADAQALYDNLDDPAVKNNPDAFDFNGEGKVTQADAQALYAKWADSK
ncbi:dockerin type I domain-containing protein [Halococcus qingdaonensis]|uniref:dockerin type I domain-containing protein n=1 Tax=Halococcus qingdaonensis TaxID=224402 RepID=UPI0021165347|nr:dockerin type I domain-containing protein [Halococcus qingdaonensis]